MPNENPPDVPKEGNSKEKVLKAEAEKAVEKLFQEAESKDTKRIVGRVILRARKSFLEFLVKALKGVKVAEELIAKHGEPRGLTQTMILYTIIHDPGRHDIDELEDKYKQFATEKEGQEWLDRRTASLCGGSEDDLVNKFIELHGEPQDPIQEAILDEIRRTGEVNSSSIELYDYRGTGLSGAEVREIMSKDKEEWADGKIRKYSL